MKHVVCFSGGKDSTALILWAKENLSEFTTVFCDTGWEHPITLAYVDEINNTLLEGKLVTLRSEKYPQGFTQLVIDRKLIPGVKSRFCTQELKVFPLHAYFEGLDDEVTSYQGIRADESASRAAMTEREWLDDAGGYFIERPILRWTAAQCFDKMREHGVKPNPLYLTGSSRVGCWPCIMTGLAELKRIIQFYPELAARLTTLEKAANDSAEKDGNYRSWFRADKIPSRFCSKSVTTKDGRTVAIPTCEDVFRYIAKTSEHQLSLLDDPPRSCMSVYNLCE